MQAADLQREQAIPPGHPFAGGTPASSPQDEPRLKVDAGYHRHHVIR